MEVNGQLYAPAALPPGKQPHWIGGWVEPKAGLDAVVKRKIPSLPLPRFEPRSSSTIQLNYHGSGT